MSRFSLSNYPRRGGGGDNGIQVIRPEFSGRMPAETLAWPGVTIFKPYPGVSEDRTRVLPWCDETDPGQYIAWASMVEQMVRSTGQRRKVTFNAALPAHEREQFAQSPYGRLYEHYNRLAFENDPKACSLIRKNPNAGRKDQPPISEGRPHMLIQAALYYKDANPNKAPRMLVPPRDSTMMLSPSMWEALDKVLWQRQFDQSTQQHIVTGPNPHAVDLFTDGCPKMLMFHALKNGLRGKPEGFQILASSHDLSQIDPNGSVNFAVAHIVMPPANLPVPNHQMALQRVVPWDQLLDQLSVSQQMLLICSAFNPDVIADAFRDSEYEPLLPESVKRYLDDVRSGRIAPNAGYGQQPHGQQGQAPWQPQGQQGQQQWGPPQQAGQQMNPQGQQGQWNPPPGHAYSPPQPPAQLPVQPPAAQSQQWYDPTAHQGQYPPPTQLGQPAPGYGQQTQYQQTPPPVQPPAQQQNPQQTYQQPPAQQYTQPTGQVYQQPTQQPPVQQPPQYTQPTGQVYQQQQQQQQPGQPLAQPGPVNEKLQQVERLRTQLREQQVAQAAGQAPTQ